MPRCHWHKDVYWQSCSWPLRWTIRSHCIKPLSNHWHWLRFDETLSLSHRCDVEEGVHSQSKPQQFLVLSQDQKNKTHHEYSATAVKGDRPHNRCLFKALIDPYWGLVLQKTLCIHLSWGPGISPFSQWTFTVAMAGQRLELKICCCFHQWIPIWWRWNDISWNYKNKSLNSGISAISKHTHWSSPPCLPHRVAFLLPHAILCAQGRPRTFALAPDG